MTGTSERTYRTREFAALAGVTTRALRHYDRLGLLRPTRSTSGYRLYSEKDLESLEEIVVLKFIGVPLKAIVAIRRRPSGAFADVIRAQRAALEEKRKLLTRAIEAVGVVEAALNSGAAVDATLFRQVMEVMQMDTDHEETLAKYVGMLKSKMAHLMAMSPAQREELRQAWATLGSDVTHAIAAGDAPGSPVGQQLLDRWNALFQAATGADATTAATAPVAPSFEATPDLRDALWARRADWMPTGRADEASEPATADEAQDRAKRLVQSLATPDVVDFIDRARAARA